MSEATRTDELTVSEHRAIKALVGGSANEEQQKLAVTVIVKKLARYGDVPFIPGEPDSSAFLSGRGFVGARIRLLANAKINETIGE